MSNDEHFLVTGALGCIGSWTVAQLAREGVNVTAYDLGGDNYRVRYLLEGDELSAIDFIQGDIADLDRLEQVTATNRITHIIHLAALQVPFCKADPALGALVNVVGTVNVFEVAKRLAEHVQRVVYASSAAVYGPTSMYPSGPVPADVALYPGTHYGVYKQANEGTARIYWQDEGVTSIGLRPYIVYGIGRDQGMTSGASKAMLAAAAGRPYRIPHGGRADFHLASDVARTLIECARAPYQGASVHNLKGEGTDISQVVAAIGAAAGGPEGQITYEADVIFPFPETLSEASLAEIIGEVPHTPFEEGVRRTVLEFRQLIEADKIDVDQSLS